MSSPKARPWLSNTDRLAALDDWVHAYNTRQAHSAIGGYPPIARLAG
jgi:transposase InsO family protein